MVDGRAGRTGGGVELSGALFNCNQRRVRGQKFGYRRQVIRLVLVTAGVQKFGSGYYRGCRIIDGPLQNLFNAVHGVRLSLS